MLMPWRKTMDEFFCGGCGKYKKLALKAKIKRNRPICISCVENIVKLKNKPKHLVNAKKRSYKHAQEIYANGSDSALNKVLSGHLHD